MTAWGLMIVGASRMTGRPVFEVASLLRGLVRAGVRLGPAVSLLALAVSCASGGTSGFHPPPQPPDRVVAPAPRELWRWDVPAGSSAGMPAVAADGSGQVAFTYGRHALVLLEGRQEPAAMDVPHTNSPCVGSSIPAEEPSVCASSHVAAPNWQAELVGLRDVAPLITPAAVVVATDYGVAAFDRGDGSLLWHSLLGDWASAPVSVAGWFVVSLWDGAVVALDPVDGLPVWKVGLGGRALAPPAVATAEQSVVVSWDSDGRAGVTSVSASDGSVQWTVAVAPFGVSGTVVIPGVGGSHPLVVFVAGDRRAHALALPDGEPRWSFALEGAGSPEVVPAVGPGPGHVVVGHRLGGFAVLGATDGAWRWGSASDGAAVRGSPVTWGDSPGAGPGPAVAMPLDDGRVLVATPRGRAELSLTPGRLGGTALDAEGSLLVAGRGPGPAYVAAVAGWGEGLPSSG